MTDISTDQSSKTDFLTRPLVHAIALDWEKIAYVAFMAVALITRLWGLGDRVMSHDESLHTQFSLQYFRGEGFNHTPLMHGPFLFHITPLFYWLFGVSDFSARLPVALFGVALVGMPYFLRNWLGRVGALTTSFLFLISPFIVYYSRYIRHDIYVIVWALIVFIASWYFLRHRRDRYLWWFAAGLALMFSTKEVAFIYVAIFGSFLVIRLAVRLLQATGVRELWPRVRMPLLVLLTAVALLGAGYVGLELEDGAAGAGTVTATPEDSQGFAADPDQAAQTEVAAEGPSAWRWLLVAGAVGVGLGAFLIARSLRADLDEHPEFDLIILYSTLILPTISPLLVVVAGFNPLDYTISKCELAGQETMSALQLLIARAGNSVCVDAFLSSGFIRTGAFVVLTLVASILVGLWWNRRRWLIAAAIFHSIFLVLYTSVFTNPSGWASGMVGSLGYWLEQQEVQRGNQPSFYYSFVVPFYEFLPLIFSLLAIWLWTKKERISRIVGYWFVVLAAALLTYDLGDWLINRPIRLEGGEPSNIAALVAAGAVLGAGIVYWLLVGARRTKGAHEGADRWRDIINLDGLTNFVPSVIWWMLLTWIIYRAAGEKMPWLSTHFVIPMAILSGWYMQQRLNQVDVRELLTTRTLLAIGLVMSFFAVVVLAVKPLLLGEVELGAQTQSNLAGLGSLLGMFLLAAALLYLLFRGWRHMERPLRRLSLTLGIFGLLSLLTIRFTYMSSWPNADYAKEFMVYAHAAPAVKSVVMEQVDELSWRVHGDKSLKVAWSDDVTWPIQWYLRDYPNRLYAAKVPNAGITEYPIVIVGSLDWDEYENFLHDDEYMKQDYTFLWWPMEEYRNIGWNAVFGVGDIPDAEGSTRTGRGILDADVRAALWDIFFYRNYEKYGEVFNKTLTDGEWPLRHELRLYIRRDVLADLWDYGVAATTIEPPVDPYAANELDLTPELVLGDGGLHSGELVAPRNLAIAPDGTIFVADSGRDRIVAFGTNGDLLRDWGTTGDAPGNFNQPWGLAADDEFVYVADTWNHRVQKFTHEGEFVDAFGESGTVAEIGANSGGYFFGPRSLVLLPDNGLLVTDTGNHRLQLFDREGNFQQTIGQQGTQPGQFNEPVGLGSGPDNSILVADTWNARIQRFTPSLVPNFTWPFDGWEGNSAENKPYLAVDSAGRVYATDPENARVVIFDADGTYLARFGKRGDGIDSLGLVNGITIDGSDNIYVVDAVNNRVLRYPAIDFDSLDVPAAGQPADANAPANGDDTFEDAP